MSDTSTYTVTGMTCGHCVASVTEEVRRSPASRTSTSTSSRRRSPSPAASPSTDAAVAGRRRGSRLRSSCMSTPTQRRRLRRRLAVAFGAALGRRPRRRPGRRRLAARDGATTATRRRDGHGTGTATAEARPTAELPGGLEVAQDGYRLVLTESRCRRRAAATAHVHRSSAPTAQPLTDYDGSTTSSCT